jgi:hypothetical protein
VPDMFTLMVIVVDFENILRSQFIMLYLLPVILRILDGDYPFVASSTHLNSYSILFILSCCGRV